MIRAILAFCIRERVIVLLATTVILAVGWYAVDQVPIDAIPNVGENQVIVFSSWPGRSPKDIEDQVTYPLSVALLAVPGAESVRGKSLFGYSFVQVTFAENIEFYWARSRVSEQLASATGNLPEGVTPTLGPDATALGQIFYYTLEPPPGMDLSELRSLQDFTIKYALQAVEGVSEVASIGGYVRQYQIELDPNRLRFHDIPIDRVIAAVKASNIDVGAKTVESGGMEFIIRGKGFIGAKQELGKTLAEIEETVVLTREGVPVRIRDLGYVQAGPAFRRGALDLNGSEAVGGVVVMRFGENPRKVIERIRKKIKQLEPDLGGVKINGIYDRTDLIDETVTTLATALWQEILITIVVVVLFLLHIRTSLVVAISLPIAVLMAFIAMHVFGIDANIMSLAGIAIAIGTMVDMGIVVSENIYGHLATWEATPAAERRSTRENVIHEAASEVVPAVMTAVATTVVSFLPVFFLTGREYRLFAPLAWTKTFALVASLLVAVLLVPLLCRLLLWKVRPIERNPVSRLITAAYVPTLRLFLRHKLAFLSLPTTIVLVGAVAWVGLSPVLRPAERLAGWLGADLNEVPGYVDLKHSLTGLKTDDWIALDEGSWFFMPSLYPAASFSQAMQALQTEDLLIKNEVPEVKNVLGKIGRVDSALDPAPAAMVETYVTLKPKEEWRQGMTERKIWNEINRVAKLPGVTPASPLQPIEGRVVMLQSGITASMAIRIYGDRLDRLAEATNAVKDYLKRLPQIDAETVNPDIVLGKPYVEFDVDRNQAARYGMTTRMVNEVVEAALGGTTVTTTVEGRERYPVQIRYQREQRERIEDLRRLPVVTPTGEVVPLEALATMTTTWGPPAINSEDARLVAHVMFSPSGTMGDLETAATIEAALAAQDRDQLKLPPGYEVRVVGSFENQIEANRRLMWLVPLAVAIILFLIYLQFRQLSMTLAIASSVPVAFAGGMILLAVTGIEMNTAVWVGFIALFGIAVDDGIVMATYMQQTFARRAPQSIDEIRGATIEAGGRRIRPCLMTTFTTLAALTPVLLATGRGADVAQAMALPVFGGMLIEPITLFIVPLLYCGYQEMRFRASKAQPTAFGETA